MHYRTHVPGEIVSVMPEAIRLRYWSFGTVPAVCIHIESRAGPLVVLQESIILFMQGRYRISQKTSHSGIHEYCLLLDFAGANSSLGKVPQASTISSVHQTSTGKVLTKRCLRTYYKRHGKESWT